MDTTRCQRDEPNTFWGCTAEQTWRKLVKAMAHHLDESIPKACGDWASIKGAYRWISHPEVTHEKILQAHREATLGRMEQSQDLVILIHDTVYMQPSAELEGPWPPTLMRNRWRCIRYWR